VEKWTRERTEKERKQRNRKKGNGKERGKKKRGGLCPLAKITAGAHESVLSGVRRYYYVSQLCCSA